MNYNRIPDNEELARSIAVAFDALPGPDEERLAAVGRRLQEDMGRREKRPRRQRQAWSWLWLLLAGGTVAAAWWSGSAFFGGDTTPGDVREKVSSPAIEHDGEGEGEKDDDLSGDRGVPGKQPHTPERDSPIIYQQETR